mmetsp:Transcript_14548/g.36955  ORF Transcript_14548/g.36955 Transcript_14548/m.36955 type:complete len:270 (-) Transcript_14548:781-1590(-)
MPSAAPAPAPGASMMMATGRSSHLGCGIATTAAIATSSNAEMWFSMSIEEIHSPPDLITSFDRSVMTMAPPLSSFATSPVMSQPLWNLSEAEVWKYSVMIHGPRTKSSPACPRTTSRSRLSESAMRTSTPGTGMPAFTILLNNSSGVFVKSQCFTTLLANAPRGFVSVMPHPCKNSTPSVSQYHCIICAGGAEPPHVRVLRCNSFANLSTPRFVMAAWTPCHTVGTPVLNCTFQSSIASSVESGSINLPVKTMRVPNINVVKGTPQLST